MADQLIESVEEESTEMTGIQKSRITSEIQASLLIAQRFPRDEIEVEQKVIENCKRFSFASKAIFAFPRGGQTVAGLSIRAAEAIARHYGNLRFGFIETDATEEHSKVEAYAWDLERNVYENRAFTVFHKIQLKNGSIKRLTDVRDRYENMANQASRRVRACILALLPPEIKETAEQVCRKTLEAGEKSQPLIDRVRRAVLVFAEIGVSQDMLERRLKHGVDLMNASELVDLLSIYNSIKDGQAKRTDFFDFGIKEDSGAAEELSKKLLSIEDKKS